MTIHLTNRVAAATVALGFTLLTAGTHAQVAAPLSEIKVIVVDPMGARIPGSEVTFKGDSRTIVSHMGSDGAATVTLPSGQYSVTVSALGFLKNNVPEFQVVAPVPGELKVALEPGPVVTCGPCIGPMIDIQTVSSDLPNVIEDEPIPVLPVPPATRTRKTRSLQCLYLWKCSAS